MNLKFLLTVFLCFGMLLACVDKNGLRQKLVAEYYGVYAEREDFKKFLGYYDEAVVFEDMINGDRLHGKKAIAAFFNWDDPNFKLLDSVAFEASISSSFQIRTTLPPAPHIFEVLNNLSNRNEHHKSKCHKGDSNQNRLY